MQHLDAERSLIRNIIFLNFPLELFFVDHRKLNAR